MKMPHACFVLGREWEMKRTNSTPHIQSRQQREREILRFVVYQNGSERERRMLSEQKNRKEELLFCLLIIEW